MSIICKYNILTTVYTYTKYIGNAEQTRLTRVNTSCHCAEIDGDKDADGECMEDADKDLGGLPSHDKDPCGSGSETLPIILNYYEGERAFNLPAPNIKK